MRIKLCRKCRAQFAELGKTSNARARAKGVRVGRPLVSVSEADLDRIRRGELDAYELAEELGCNRITIQRRLGQQKRQLGRDHGEEERGSEQERVCAAVPGQERR
jgi:hypothetical protein